MRFSKRFVVTLVALVCAASACSFPSAKGTPQPVAQVVTQVTTETLPALSQTLPLQVTGTIVPSDTSSNTSISTLAATDTLVPGPSDTIPVALANTPSQTPEPQLPVVSNLPAQGPQGGAIDFSVVMSPSYLMRIKARKHGTANDGDGIDHVLFIVIGDSNVTLYTSTEKVAKFCIFKGGEADCNPWPISNGHFVWGSGGPEIKSGQYQVTIRIALKSDPTNESEWNFFMTIKLP